jgi:hypothetical protein
MKKIILIVLLLVISLSAKTFSETKQLIVVTTQGWNDNSGVLQRYERTEGKWLKVSIPVAVTLGRYGRGWGRGLHTFPKGAK